MEGNFTSSAVSYSFKHVTEIVRSGESYYGSEVAISNEEITECPSASASKIFYSAEPVQERYTIHVQKTLSMSIECRERQAHACVNRCAPTASVLCCVRRLPFFDVPFSMSLYQCPVHKSTYTKTVPLRKLSRDTSLYTKHTYSHVYVTSLVT